MLSTILNTIPFVGVNFNVRGLVAIRRGGDAAYSQTAHLSARRRRHQCMCLHLWLELKSSMWRPAPAFVRTS